MTKLTEQKKQAMRRLSNESGVIAALAIDQRGALKKMIAVHKPQGAEDKDIIDFKTLVSKELTSYASSILLDPEYGLPAAEARASNAGLYLHMKKLVTMPVKKVVFRTYSIFGPQNVLKRPEQML